jgi:hypothetical protein
VAGYLLFGLRERTAAAPLMQVRLLATRSVGTGAFLMLVATALLVGGFFLGSFYLQQVRGYSAVHTGLTFLPLAVAIILGAQASGHLATVLDRRALTAGALALAAVGETVAALWHGPVALITGLSVASIGIGAALVAASTTPGQHPARRGRPALRSHQHLPRARQRAGRRGPVQPGRAQPDGRQPHRLHPLVRGLRRGRTGHRAGRDRPGSARPGRRQRRPARPLAFRAPQPRSSTS